MKDAPVPMKLDAVLEPGESIQIEIQDELVGGGQRLYLNVNGSTVVRIGRINTRIEVKDSTRDRRVCFTF